MDIVGSVLSGLISASIGLILFGISAKIAIPRLRARIYDEIDAFRVGAEQRAIELANQFIADLLNDAIQHPEKLQPLIDALTSQGLKSLGIGKEKATPSMKIGGFKVPGFLLDHFAPIIAKKLGGATAEKVAEATLTPFG